MSGVREELLEISTISYGHMIRRDNFKEELKPILEKWKLEENLFVDRASEVESITILRKCYDENISFYYYDVKSSLKSKSKLLTINSLRVFVCRKIARIYSIKKNRFIQIG